MWHWLGAICFLGSMGGLVIILAIVYVCVLHNMCWCQKGMVKRTEEDDHETLLHHNFSESGDKEYEPLYDKISCNEQFNAGPFSYVLTPADDIFTSDNGTINFEPFYQDNNSQLFPSMTSKETLSWNQSDKSLGINEYESQAGEITTPNKNKRGKHIKDSLVLPYKGDKETTSLNQSVESLDTSEYDSQVEVSTTSTKSKKIKFVKGCKLRMSFLKGNGENALVFTLNEVSGMSRSYEGGYTHVRISAVLMPDRVQRHCTVWHMIQNDEIVVFGDSFMFINVNQLIRSSSNIRLRLYGKRKGKRICIGEMTLSVTAVMEKENGSVAVRYFERKK